MNNSSHRWDNAEITVCLLPPFKKFIAFAVALEFNLRIACERIGCRKEIHLDGMISDKVYRHKWVDLPRVTAKTGNRGPHRCQIHYSRDSGELLQDDTPGQQRTAGAHAFGCPCRDVLYIGLSNLFVIALTESRLEQDSDGKRKQFEVHKTGFFQRVEAINHIFLFPNF